jgi:hypothetical protein
MLNAYHVALGTCCNSSIIQFPSVDVHCITLLNLTDSALASLTARILCCALCLVAQCMVCIVCVYSYMFLTVHCLCSVLCFACGSVHPCCALWLCVLCLCSVLGCAVPCGCLCILCVFCLCSGGILTFGGLLIDTADRSSGFICTALSPVHCAL